MNGWNNVLVLADARPESAAAISEALKLTAPREGRVTALDVLEVAAIDLPRGLLAMEQDELLTLIREQRHEQLVEQIGRVRGDRRIEVQVSRGRPAFELIRQASRGRHDLIVKAARGRDVRHLTAFGTVALHLVRKSPIPVLLVNAATTPAAAGAPVLCALELDGLDSRVERNEKLLGAARSLAEAYDGPLHVVHVIDRERLNVYRSALGADAYREFLADRVTRRRVELERHVEAARGGLTEIHAHLIEGNPGDVLVDLTRQLGASHLVIGSVEQSIPGLLIGSLAEEVLMRVDCSVLALKPPGFQTPVELTRATVRPGEAVQ